MTKRVSRPEISIPAEWDPSLTMSAGRVAVAFGQLEYVVRLWVDKLLGAGVRRGLIVTDRTGLSALLEMLMALFCERHSDQDKINAFGRLLAEANRVRIRRNELIHSVWAVDAKGRQIHLNIRRSTKAKSPKSGLVRRAPVIELEALDQLANDIVRVADALNRLRAGGAASLKKAKVARSSGAASNRALPHPIRRMPNIDTVTSEKEIASRAREITQARPADLEEFVLAFNGRTPKN